MPSAKVKLLSYKDNISRLSIVIDEGLNRQIRRMFEVIGREIVLLKRVAIGGLKLGGLMRGEYKKLSERDIESIFEARVWKLR